MTSVTLAGGWFGCRLRKFPARPVRPRSCSDHENIPRFRRIASLLVLPQVAGCSRKADLLAIRLSQGLYMRRVRWGVQLNPRGRPQRSCAWGCAGAATEAARGEGVSGRVCDRAGPDQEEAGRRGLQPLQAHPDEQDTRQRCGVVEVEYSAGRPDRFGQDAAGADAGEDAGRAVRNCGRDHADRSRICGRGCGEHYPEAAAGGRRRCDTGAERHYLHRRDRQDRAQGREPFDHPRCFRRRACSRRC